MWSSVSRSLLQHGFTKKAKGGGLSWPGAFYAIEGYTEVVAVVCSRVRTGVDRCNLLRLIDWQFLSPSQQYVPYSIFMA